MINSFVVSFDITVTINRLQGKILKAITLYGFYKDALEKNN